MTKTASSTVIISTADTSTSTLIAQDDTLFVHEQEGAEEEEGGGGNHRNNVLRSSWIYQNRHCLVFILMSLIMSSSMLCNKQAHRSFPATVLSASRLLIGSVCIIPTTTMITYWRNRHTQRQHEQLNMISPLQEWRTYVIFVVLGLLNTSIPYTLYPLALGKGLNLGITAIITGSSPIFTQVIAVFFIPAERKRITFLSSFGMIIGIAGIVLLAMNKIISSANSSSNCPPSDAYILVVIAALCKASAAVFAQVQTHAIPPLLMATGQTVFGSIFAVVASLFVHFHVGGLHGKGWNDIDANWQGILGLLYLGILSSCAVYICQFYLINTIGSIRMMLADLLVPVVGLIEGVIIFGEWSHGNATIIIVQIAGCILVCVAIVTITIVRRSGSLDDDYEDRIALNS